jgi:hypothetical protein
MKESGMGKQFTKRALGGAILATVLPPSALAQAPAVQQGAAAPVVLAAGSPAGPAPGRVDAGQRSDGRLYLAVRKYGFH